MPILCQLSTPKCRPLKHNVIHSLLACKMFLGPISTNLLFPTNFTSISPYYLGTSQINNRIASFLSDTHWDCFSFIKDEDAFYADYAEAHQKLSELG